MHTTTWFNTSKGLHFTNMGEKPLGWDVKCKNTVVIPKGTTGVKIAFRQSHIKFFNEGTGKWQKFNVYLYKGRLYHA